jgi:SAM-dependent methyltransferase
METNKKSLDASFFNALYEKNKDPWNFDGSEYERNKYMQTMSMIPDEIYAHIFEIGCSNGVLSMLLKERGKKLLAVDSSTIAVNTAKKRLSEYPNVVVMEMEVPKDFPDDSFDLILLSEVGYFLVEPDLITLRDRIIEALPVGGHLLLVHWTPWVEEFPLTGDQVHEIFLQMAGKEATKPLLHVKNQTEEQYRMDLFLRQ